MLLLKTCKDPLLHCTDGIVTVVYVFETETARACMDPRVLGSIPTSIYECVEVLAKVCISKLPLSSIGYLVNRINAFNSICCLYPNNKGRAETFSREEKTV